MVLLTKINIDIFWQKNEKRIVTIILKHNIPTGVSQGSIFGSLLFVIFINNLPIDIKSKIKLFANDVKILFWP